MARALRRLLSARGAGGSNRSRAPSAFDTLPIASRPPPTDHPNAGSTAHPKRRRFHPSSEAGTACEKSLHIPDRFFVLSDDGPTPPAKLRSESLRAYGPAPRPAAPGSAPALRFADTRPKDTLRRNRSAAFSLSKHPPESRRSPALRAIESHAPPVRLSNLDSQSLSANLQLIFEADEIARRADAPECLFQSPAVQAAPRFYPRRPRTLPPLGVNPS